MTTPLTRLTTCATTFAVLAGATSATLADFTSVPMSSTSEADHPAISEALSSSGTAWHPSGSRTEGVGNIVAPSDVTLAATRVDDWGSDGVRDVLAPLFTETDDQGGIRAVLTLTPVSRHTIYVRELGYDLDGDDRGRNDMLDQVAAPVLEPGASLTVMLTCGVLALLLRRTR
ncbi:MAG: hypothetical protein ACE5I3_07370 [Phycisphaerae bacterium]